ncbi:MAG: AraC family transcriptional regulator [Muribaculaceae bacterium]|nr:AraC family transcriptional regulator [Muribaculaceae bacterium]
MKPILEYPASNSEAAAASDGVTEFCRLADNYAFARITSTPGLSDFISRTVRLDGFTIMLCQGGRLDLEVNARECSVTERKLFVAQPDSLLSVKEVYPEGLDLYVLVISTDFLNDLTFDLNVINAAGFNPEREPTLELDDAQAGIMLGYFKMIHANTLTNPDALFVRGISGNLMSAAMYQMIQFYYTALKNSTGHTAPRPMSRRNNYVREFLALVHRNHRRERSTAFYASKLFISAKYLSHIIKDSTGRSAAEWIDHYVILEAKNLLRYSGKNVQQVAYELNFPNQSAFGKYFKHLTGMSPTEFQKR